jgi:molecular chaperone DnaK
MESAIGIDLGTTYSCVAFIDEDGTPRTIPNSDGADTTPSVVWFDGKTAYVGKKANDRKITPTSPVFEFVKRDMGKSPRQTPGYTVGGYPYGPAGLSALILRKLKKEAFNFLKKKGAFPPSAEEKNTIIPAVITVPAYFGDLQRQQTRTAGYAAGLHVTAIINEPTAAALAFGKTLRENKTILVFDLGGGTFDITILEVRDGEGIVKASDGSDELGGKDWDELITDFLYSYFRRVTGRDIPDDMGWEVQQKALQAKFDLTRHDMTTVIISHEEGDVEIPLYRADPGRGDPNDDFRFDADEEAGPQFYFEARASGLLSLCRTLCTSVMEKAGLAWGDLDEIVLAGGSCRMPMIPDMLEALTGKKIARHVPGFSYDTAIAVGAALYGARRGAVRDVTSKTIGVEVKMNGTPYVEHLIRKNAPLPARVEKSFRAEPGAVLKVFEGDSHQADECILRGRLELKNPEGGVSVKVTMTVNGDGVLHSLAEYPPDVRKELVIQTDDGEVDREDLKRKISTIDVRL